jgi:hypothetical protein
MIFATEIYGDEIFSYSRKKAIEDGQLLDLTKAAKVAGFRLPVAITQTAWNSCVEWIQEKENIKTNKEKIIRLRNMLRMIYPGCRRNPWRSSFIHRIFLIPYDQSTKLNQIELKIVIGAGDKGEAVITIMLPYED